MNAKLVRRLVEECVAQNPVAHIPIYVESVSEADDVFTVVLGTEAEGLGDFDYVEYYKKIEKSLAGKAGPNVVLRGLQPDTRKSKLRRDTMK